jgi:hypothetical protein
MTHDRLLNLGFILGGAIVSALILEAGLRLAGVSYPYFYVPDPVLGYAHKPNAEGWWKKEGFAHIRINRAGFRDRDHTEAKQPGTFRIAVLGDSYSEALQVSLDETYWAVLESDLAQCPAFDGRRVEVLNFGVSGYGTAQELLLLRHRVWDYAPDLILLAVLTLNDIQENSYALAGDLRRPYFVLRNGQLELDTRFRDQLRYRIRSLPFGSEIFEISRLLQVLREAEYRIPKILRGLLAGSDIQARPEWTVYVENPGSQWEEAWRVTEALLAEVHNETDRRHAGLLLVTLSNPEQVHPELVRRDTIAALLGQRDLLYPDRRIARWAGQHGVINLALAEPLGSYAAAHQVFLHGFPNTVMGEGHWNVEGHRLAGKLIAERICSLQQMAGQ